MSGTVLLSSASLAAYKGGATLDQTDSLIGLGVALAAAAAAWLGLRARQRSPLATHALFPWGGLLFAALVVAAALAAHVLGVGRPRT